MLSPTTPPEARRLILVACIAAVAMASLAEFGNDRTPPIRIVLGGVVAAVLLSTLAEITPQVAGAFGLVILTTALFATGQDSYKALSNAVAGPTPFASRKDPPLS